MVQPLLGIRKAGVAVTEFPAAQRALDRSREGLAHMVGDGSDDDETKVEQKKKIAEQVADLVFDDDGEGRGKGEKKKPNSKELFKQIAQMNGTKESEEEDSE